MKLIILCLVLSAIYGVAHSQHNESGLIEILESNKFVVINFVENGTIDKEFFTLTFTVITEQIKNDYKEEKGLINLVQINCECDTTLCYNQLSIKTFPAIRYFNYGQFGVYTGKPEIDPLLEFISNNIGAPIKVIPKTSVYITIKYLFNGLYNNGLVNFIRAYELLKQHCDMQLVNTKEITKSSMVALVSPGINTSFEPLYLESPKLNVFSLDEVMRFIQSKLNADYKIQGNTLLYFEKIRVNITFPLNNNLTTPKVNSSDVRIPNLKPYKLQTIISCEEDFLNLLKVDINLKEAWEQIKAYHTVTNDDINQDELEYEEVDYDEIKDSLEPSTQSQPPNYYPNTDDLHIDQQNVLVRDWSPGPAINVILNSSIWSRQPNDNKQHIPPYPLHRMPNNYNYPINDDKYYQSGNTNNHHTNYNYPIPRHPNTYNHPSNNQSPIHSRIPNNYNYPMNNQQPLQPQIPSNYNYPMNNRQYNSGTEHKRSYNFRNEPSYRGNQMSTNNHNQGMNGNSYGEYYSNQQWSSSGKDLNHEASRTYGNNRRVWN